MMLQSYVQENKNRVSQRKSKMQILGLHFGKMSLKHVVYKWSASITGKNNHFG